MRALILDFDGLMVDTEWPSFLAWREVYNEHGAELYLPEWSARVGSDHGFNPIKTLRARSSRPLGDIDALLADRQRRKAARVASKPLMPGVREVIAQARHLGWAVGVASSSPYEWVGGHLTRLGMLDIVDAVRTRDDVHRVKPDPEVFLLAADALGVPPEDCVVCEDSLNGIRAAKAAGMFSIAVPNRVTVVQDFAEADLQVRSLSALRLSKLPPV
ncbi:MAG: HAD superfamily hydrolase (TIGR01509 family) [Myxococcota bacterium]|jgi:HAD superfamily hydrolase (TIGR01509 family)